MKKRFLSIILMLAMLCSFTACKNNKQTSSDDASTSSDIASDNNSADNNSGTDSTNASSGQTSGSGNQNEAGGIDYNSLKGTTVSVLMWRALTEQEKNTISAFEKKYSMKVNVEQAKSSAYLTKIASLVSTKKSPDVAVIPGGKGSQGAFPLGVVSIFQPATVTKQDFNDSFWNREAMNAYAIKGKPYAIVSSQTNWYNNYEVLFYNADMFKADGITTPYTLWKQGKWNWDTLKSTAQEIKKKGHDYGLMVDQEFNFVKSTGTEFIAYDGNKFTNNITNAKVIDAWTFEAQLVKEQLMPVYGTATSSFTSGKCGMFVTNSWAMRKGEVLATADFNLECVPSPSPAGQEQVVGASHNLFAIPKGAKNPVGAGVFLRYFLDASNNGKFSDVALSTQFEEVFNYTNQSNLKHSYLYCYGVVGYTNYKSLSNLLTSLHKASPEQVPTVLQQNKSVFDNAVNTANKKLGN
ncbi:MAG TPA: hypothetical protein DDY61_07280 [Ruminococcaceae bacterium]|nr:hypothetical protein [Oscillospiraceae bacterium]